MKRKILLLVILIFFALSIKSVYAGSTVSVTGNTVYKITGETVNGVARYILDLAKNVTNYPLHGERNLTIFDMNFPIYEGSSNNIRTLRVSNITFHLADIIFLKACSELIESGPNRVYIRYENSSSSYGSMADCASNGVCFNWTADFYLYPRYYLVRYNVIGNFTSGRFNNMIIPYEFSPIGGVRAFNVTGSYWSNGTYQNASNSLQMFAKFNESVAFSYNTTGHNKTFAAFSISPHDFSSETNSWSTSMSWSTYFDFSIVSATETFTTRNNFTWGYGLLFAESGNKTLAQNYSVWLGFKDQWFDLYYPASVSPINGSFLGRDNITATYNFTVDSSGLLRFNFSTNGIKHFLPVFHIKDITSNSSFYKDHIWMKNYSKPNPQWEKLNNWTDFVIQDGNSSYFGYNYILLLINKTLASDYEFWISNESNPVQEDTQAPYYSLNSTNSTIAGTAVSHNLFWQDDLGLSYAIFSFDNCTGEFQNISETSLSGTQSWSNFTVTINETIGCTIRWKVYANDSNNSWNESEVFSYITTQPLLPLPPPQPSGGVRGAPTILPNYSMKILELPTLVEINQSSNLTVCFILNNTGNAKLTNISIVLSGIPREWYKITPENIKELNVTQRFSVCIYLTIPEDAPVKDYLLTINASDKAKAFSNLTLKVLPKEVITYPKCPACPGCSEWSNCINNTKSRLCYYCNESSNYTCEEYYETMYCEGEIPKRIIDSKIILVLIIIVFIILLLFLMLRLKLKKSSWVGTKPKEVKEEKISEKLLSKPERTENIIEAPSEQTEEEKSLEEKQNPEEKKENY